MKRIPQDMDLGSELISSMKEAVAIKNGELQAARTHIPEGYPDVRSIREKTGLTRETFAKTYGLKPTAVRDWEQGLRRPDPSAQTLLKVIEKFPDAVARAVATA